MAFTDSTHEEEKLNLSDVPSKTQHAAETFNYLFFPPNYLHLFVFLNQISDLIYYILTHLSVSMLNTSTDDHSCLIFSYFKFKQTTFEKVSKKGSGKTLYCDFTRYVCCIWTKGVLRFSVY